MFGLIGADVLMIATAPFFGLSTTSWIKWTWYLISCGAFLTVYYVIWGPLKQENAKEREDVRSVFTRNATILSVVWLIYPLVLLVGTDGLKLVDPTITTAAIVILDLAEGRLRPDGGGRALQGRRSRPARARHGEHRTAPHRAPAGGGGGMKLDRSLCR